jgi:hypothetical protein
MGCFRRGSPGIAPKVESIIHRQGQTMATSSILGGDRAAPAIEGRDVDALGPSDTTDSGSDIQGIVPSAGDRDDAPASGIYAIEHDSDSDAMGTGERASAGGADSIDGADILPDHIERMDGDTDTGEQFLDDVEDLAADEDLEDEATADASDGG